MKIIEKKKRMLIEGSVVYLTKAGFVELSKMIPGNKLLEVLPLYKIPQNQKAYILKQE